MMDRISSYIKTIVILSAIVWGILCLLHGIPISIGQAYGYFENIAAFMLFFSFIYIRWLWRWAPWEKCPRFEKHYKGELHSSYGNGIKKEFDMFVSQTLFTIDISIKTNEITSESTTSNLMPGKNCWVLYYIYSTTPKASFSENNPMQIGSARFEIEEIPLSFWHKLPYRKKVQKIEGTYWTNRQTIGDMQVWKESKAELEQNSSFSEKKSHT